MISVYVPCVVDSLMACASVSNGHVHWYCNQSKNCSILLGSTLKYSKKLLANKSNNLQFFYCILSILFFLTFTNCYYQRQHFVWQKISWKFPVYLITMRQKCFQRKWQKVLLDIFLLLFRKIVVKWNFVNKYSTTNYKLNT